MKKVSIYSSDFSNQDDWNDFLEELDYSKEERETIDEIELTVQSAEVPDQTIETKNY
jgi:hypothetical protein